MAILFAILCVGGSIGGGNMFQANQAFAAFKTVFPSMSDFGPIFGLFLALMVGFVIIGGIKSIAKVTEKIVPFMVSNLCRCSSSNYRIPLYRFRNGFWENY